MNLLLKRNLWGQSLRNHCKMGLSRGLPWNVHRLPDLGENGEVQFFFLNFVAQGFQIFGILAAVSGERDATENDES